MTKTLLYPDPYSEREELRYILRARPLANYTVWFSIKVFHEYYVQGACPVSVAPSAKTSYLFEKSNILFRQQNENTYCILRDENFREKGFPNEQAELSFILRAKDNSFYHLSDHITDNPAFSTEDPEIPGIWKSITLDLPHIEESQSEEIRIEITTVHKYSEYILIPKYHKADIKLRLTEQRDKIRFKEAETVELPGIPTAFRFLTEEKIRLSQTHDFHVQLWEVKENGEQLISDRIPNPKPDQYSIFDPKNVLVTYFYY